MTVSPLAARCFHRRVLGLDSPHADVAAALRYHGYVQLDPINVCGRMHDLTLRNRVAGYRENDLLRHLYGGSGAAGGCPLAAAERRAFEHYVPGLGVLAAFPIESWPWLTAHMEHRAKHQGGYGGRLTPAEARMATRVVAELAARGPLTADDIADEGRATSAWGTPGRLVKTVLEKLFFHGRVLLSTRRGFRRVYDLPERVLPPAVRNLSRPSATDGLRWGVVLRLRQRRLVLLKKTELPLVEDLVQRVVVDGCPPLHCLREDVPVLEQAATDVGSGADRPAAVAPRLLAPLDPLIYDRRLTKALWNFAYTWEVYLPAAKRQRGYFALPILNGTELAGDVDLKADRARRKLVVVSRRMRRGVAVQRSLRELSAFLGFLSDHRWRRLAGELG